MTGLARTIDFSDGWTVAITHQTPVKKQFQLGKCLSAHVWMFQQDQQRFKKF
jgi:hypothetical protein